MYHAKYTDGMCAVSLSPSDMWHATLCTTCPTCVPLTAESTTQALADVTEHCGGFFLPWHISPTDPPALEMPQCMLYPISHPLYVTAPFH